MARASGRALHELALEPGALQAGLEALAAGAPGVRGRRSPASSARPAGKATKSRRFMRDPLGGADSGGAADQRLDAAQAAGVELVDVGAGAPDRLLGHPRGRAGAEDRRRAGRRPGCRRGRRSGGGRAAPPATGSSATSRITLSASASGIRATRASEGTRSGRQDHVVVEGEQRRPAPPSRAPGTSSRAACELRRRRSGPAVSSGSSPKRALSSATMATSGRAGPRAGRWAPGRRMPLPSGPIIRRNRPVFDRVGRPDVVVARARR